MAPQTRRARLQEVEVQALDAARLEPLIGPDRMAAYEAIAETTRRALAGRAVLNVNSTATGGGVAEMLQTLLAYVRGAGIDARWLVAEGDPEFFTITKRMHNGLYGGAGDGGPLGDAERGHYEGVLRRNAEGAPGAHQARRHRHPARSPAGGAGGGPAQRRRPRRLALPRGPRRGQRVDRAGVGVPAPVPGGRRGDRRLPRRLRPPWADPGRTVVVPPSIDPFSAKNEPLSRRNARLALAYVGLLQGDGEPPVVPFARRDGSPGRINRHADVLQSGPPALPDAPLVIQASRWDRMKDMAGVMEGFARHVDPALGAHLVLAGPAVTGVADDPEAADVLRECVAAWRRLPHAMRGRVHLASVPMADPDEAAAIVNALQRHAAVIAQKSLAEGFGLTVTEGMWKARPIVASAVGGIVDQIDHGEHGLLVDDPHDLAAFGAAVEALLRDPAEAARLGRNGRMRAERDFLGDRHLAQYGRLFQLLG